MFNEIWQYINYYLSAEEIVLAAIGLVFIVVIWFLGGKDQKGKEELTMEQVTRKVDELRSLRYPLFSKRTTRN